MNKFLKDLKLTVSDCYSDINTTILDSEGFGIIDVNKESILEGWEEKLNIEHWCQSEEATKNLSEEDFEVLKRAVSQVSEMYKFINSVERCWDIEDNKWKELNKILQYIDHGIKKEDKGE